MATIKLRDYLLQLSTKGTSAANSDKITIIDSADSNAIKTILKEDLVDIDFIISELTDDFLDTLGDNVVSSSVQVDHDSTTNFVANEHINHSAVSMSAGAGLTGGGDLTTSRTLNIGQGTGISVSADSISTNDSEIVHDNLSGFVSNEHINHSNITLTAGAGLTGGGDITTNRTFDVVSANNGIVVNADNIELDTDSSTFTGGVQSKINDENLISGSTFSSPSQGTLRATINGVDSDVDLGLQTTDTVTFVDGNFTGNVTVNGNFNVLGDSVEIQTSQLRIEDKLITIASGSGDSITSDGAGIEIEGAGKSLKWNHATQQFLFDAKVSSSIGFKGEGGELTGIDTDQVTEAGNLYYTDGRVKTKLNTEGVVSGSSQISFNGIIDKPTLVSSSVQVNADSITNFDSNVKDKMNADGVLSGSAQLEAVFLEINGDNVVSSSAQIDHNQTTNYNSNEHFTQANITTVGTVTSGNVDAILPNGTVSGSSQIDLTQTTNYVSGIKSRLNTEQVVSGSSQIAAGGDVSGTADSLTVTAVQGVSLTSNIATQLVNIDTRSISGDQWGYLSELNQGIASTSSPNFVALTATDLYGAVNATNGVVSGSSQIDVTQTTNYGSINQYTDSDNLSYLNSLLVVSKSAGGSLDVDGDITASRLLVQDSIGNDNLAIGEDSNKNIATGADNNVSVGNFSGVHNTTGTGNTAIGWQSIGFGGVSSTLTGDYNTGIGYRSLGKLQTTAVYNTAIGALAGFDITTGYQNTLIGYGADVGTATDNNSTVIGYNAVGGGSNSVTIGGVANQDIFLEGDFMKLRDTTASGTVRFRLHSDTDTSPKAAIEFQRGANDTWGADAYRDFRMINDGGEFTLEYGESGTTQPAFTYDTSGRWNFQTGSYDITTKGVTIDASARVLITTEDNVEPLLLNRHDNDGVLIEFRQANAVEGDISVSGATVTLNGFAGAHESSGISTDSPIGTVVSTIDELDTREIDGVTQTINNHPKIKVSDVVGDSRIYGVVGNYNPKTGKPQITAVGIGSVLVTGPCNGGDLLESNGDGTAKVQADDIIRSKTIGKVTVGDSNSGVKLVSCVLYCG